MTREELMVHAAKKGIAQIASHATLYKGTIDEIEVYEPDDMIDMFKLGAEWSDENPREGLWDKDKVCRWIRGHLTFNDDKWYTDNDYVKGIMDEVIEDLTKAMEEE